MVTKMTVAVDAMGADDPHAVPDGIAQARERGHHVIAVGTEEALARCPGLDNIVTKEWIGMADKFDQTWRRGAPYSTFAAARQVAERKANAFVGFGNTGATMVAAQREIGLLSGADRSAIAVTLPKSSGYLVLLDAGANTACKPEWLVQSAGMGRAYARTLGQDKPGVYVLSNGGEMSKGTEQVREAIRLLYEQSFEGFGGPIEGHTMFLEPGVDVVVVDGFAGNIALKVLEGVAKMLSLGFHKIVANDPSKLVELGALRAKFDPHQYGAAPLLGTDGVAMIGHGGSNAQAVLKAVEAAERCVEMKMVDEIRSWLRGLAVPA